MEETTNVTLLDIRDEARQWQLVLEPQPDIFEFHACSIEHKFSN